MTFTASPAVAERNDDPSLHFFIRQLVFLGPSVFVMLFISFLDEKWVKRLAIIGVPIAFALIVVALLIGDPVKGATRWIRLGFMSIQPSEFLKPFFIVTSAWLLSARFEDKSLPAWRVSLGLYLIAVILLILQPDFGQTILLSTVWLAQMVLSGLPVTAVLLAGVIGLAGLFVAYMTVPYFASRIDRFINPESGDTYQVELARKAFSGGGLTGRGPGEGVVKQSLPDAHSDYIFAVIGEEFGAIAGVMLIVVFAAIVMRGLSQLRQEENPFKIMAAGGLLMQFGLQALINLGVNVDILPSKGMTLPFISYGGSSLLAISITMGMVLALLRRRWVHRGFAGQ